MNKAILILKATTLLTELAVALEDEELDASEILGLTEKVLAAFNVHPNLMGAKLFIELDGDLHVIVPKHILDNMKVKV